MTSQKANESNKSSQNESLIGHSKNTINYLARKECSIIHLGSKSSCAQSS